MSEQPCLVIDGEMTVYMREGKSMEDINSELGPILQTIFEENIISRAIVRVNRLVLRESFVTPSPSPIPPPESPRTTPPVSLLTNIPDVKPTTTRPIVLPTNPTVTDPTTPSTSRATATPNRVPTTLATTQVPTLSSSITNNQNSDVGPPSVNTISIEEENKEDANDEPGGLLSWWRWFLAAIIVVIMVAGILYILKRDPGKRGGQHNALR